MSIKSRGIQNTEEPHFEVQTTIMKVLLILAVALLHLAAANPNPDTNVDVQVTVNGKPIDVANSGSTGANIFVQTLPYFHLLVSHHTLQGNY